MTTLYGFFPVAMAWSMRSSVKQRADETTSSGGYVRLVPGGRFTLVLMGLGAAAIMAGQAALDSQLVRQLLCLLRISSKLQFFVSEIHRSPLQSRVRAIPLFL